MASDAKIQKAKQSEERRISIHIDGTFADEEYSGEQMSINFSISPKSNYIDG